MARERWRPVRCASSTALRWSRGGGHSQPRAAMHAGGCVPSAPASESVREASARLRLVTRGPGGYRDTLNTHVSRAGAGPHWPGPRRHAFWCHAFNSTVYKNIPRDVLTHCQWLRPPGLASERDLAPSESAARHRMSHWHLAGPGRLTRIPSLPPGIRVITGPGKVAVDHPMISSHGLQVRSRLRVGGANKQFPGPAVTAGPGVGDPGPRATIMIIMIMIITDSES
jgi:hypothetical protein